MVEFLLSTGTTDAAIISGIFGIVGALTGTFLGFLLSLLSRCGRRNVICQGMELSYYYGTSDIGDIVSSRESNFDGKVPKLTKLSLEYSIIIHEIIKTKQIGGKNSIYLELFTQFNKVYVYEKTDTFYVEYIDVKGRTIHKKIKMGGVHETEI